MVIYDRYVESKDRFNVENSFLSIIVRKISMSAIPSKDTRGLVTLAFDRTTYGVFRDEFRQNWFSHDSYESHRCNYEPFRFEFGGCEASVLRGTRRESGRATHNAGLCSLLVRHKRLHYVGEGESWQGHIHECHSTGVSRNSRKTLAPPSRRGEGRGIVVPFVRISLSRRKEW